MVFRHFRCFCSTVFYLGFICCSAEISTESFNVRPQEMCLVIREIIRLGCQGLGCVLAQRFGKRRAVWQWVFLQGGEGSKLAGAGTDAKFFRRNFGDFFCWKRDYLWCAKKFRVHRSVSFVIDKKDEEMKKEQNPVCIM